MISRRSFQQIGLGTAVASILDTGALSSRPANAGEDFEIKMTDAEWRRLLTPEQYYVLRQHGTERSHTSPLDKNYDPGTYHCAGCDLPLFSSQTKFDSRTGWPSFWQPLEDAVGTSTDYKLLYPRSEIHCRRCGGHLGHVFNDGPAPTGLRYCMNGVALKFVPQSNNES